MIDFNNPYVQYVISPAVVFSIILFIAYKLLNLGGLREQFKQALKDVENLKTDSKKLLSHLDIIKTHLVEKTGLDTGLFSSASPLKLLPKGEKLLDASGFKQIYAENKDWFLDKIRQYKTSNLAEIDEASFKVMDKCQEDAKFADFKSIAFQNGVTLDLLLRVLSIYLRDESAKELLP